MKELEQLQSFVVMNLRGEHQGLAEKVNKKIEKEFIKSKWDKVFSKEGFNLVGYKIKVVDEKTEYETVIAYSRKHKGIFPFPHDHCYLTLCGKDYCIEIEYPCNIQWPWPIDIFV